MTLDQGLLDRYLPQRVEQHDAVKRQLFTTRRDTLPCVILNGSGCFNELCNEAH